MPKVPTVTIEETMPDGQPVDGDQLPDELVGIEGTPSDNGEPVLTLPTEPQEEREVIYPDLDAVFCHGETAITQQQAKDILGWETEKEYTVRMIAAHPGLKEEQAKYKDFLLKDEEGNKVVCWHNGKNRPYSDAWARTLAQSILNRDWAGPTTMPGETVNGESIVIGRTGEVESGQHRLIGLILACQLWAGKNKARWQAKWQTEPILESLLVTGVSEAERVIRTIDNVKPRSLSDVFYTSELFMGLTQYERKECSRMLDKAVDLLWRRSGAGGSTSYEKYQTHSASLGFVDRHPFLLKCIHFMFGCNKDRAITGMRLSAGQAAAMLYMMVTSTSDGDVYRSAEQPSEKSLSWDNKDAALSFWQDLAAGKSESSQEIRKGLAALVDADSGTDGRQVEKTGVIVKAWDLWQEGHPITSDLLTLSYVEKGGKWILDDYPDFKGIDLGEGRAEIEMTPDPTPEQVAETAKKEREAKVAAVQARLEAAKAKKQGAAAAMTGVAPTPEDTMAARLQKVQEVQARMNGGAPTVQESEVIPARVTGGRKVAPAPRQPAPAPAPAQKPEVRSAPKKAPATTSAKKSGKKK